MDGQLHLGQTAVDTININVGYRFGHGYDVSVTYRRNGGTFNDDPRRVYGYLTGPEAAQVVAEEVDRLIG